MDPATIIGIVLAFGAVAGSYMSEGGSFASVFLSAPIALVMGGTLGAATITTSIETVKKIPRLFMIASFPSPFDPAYAIEKLTRLAEKARREGVLGLEKDLDTIEGDPFFLKSVQLVVDGTEMTTLREILEAEMHNISQRHKPGITFFSKAGGFAPTMGILGTVLALVHTLGHVSDTSQMAPAIASAFIATLWGVGSANLLFLPIADKLKMRHDQEMAYRELIVEGVLAMQAGDNPRHVRNRLISFIPPNERVEA